MMGYAIEIVKVFFLFPVFSNIAIYTGSYRRGNDKKHPRGVLHTPNIESLYVIELIL